MSKSVKRLYKDLKPSHYQLHIVPDMERLTFTGSVTIDLQKTARPSQRITFHQHELTITSAIIIKRDKKGDREIPVTRINNQNTLDEVRLHTEEMVYSGAYRVTLEFQGNITAGMTGLYPCYFTLDGQKHTMLATQFESHHARELFPCIDEPEAKATFDVSIVAPTAMTVLSNTPTLRTEEHTNNSVTTWFETTPKMSTYLLAFVIGEMHHVSTKTNRGTEVRAWATIAQPAGVLDYALDTSRRSIEFFEDYFGVPYPLQKMDNVALPDFSSGAMENWGLITYRERLLVAYPGETGQSVLEHIALVIAHETAHQWFGNLVTMQWWDDLWLNESFANMMEYEAVDALFPEWHVWDGFTLNEGLSALRRDAVAGVQAIKTKLRHPDEMSTLFDSSIVYAKGGRLLYMLKTYIGDEAFRAGLRQYFKQYAYGNTSGANLWEAMSTASSHDIAAFMNPWIEQSGFPVISVTVENGVATVSQKHFLENPDGADDRQWLVPLFASEPNVPDLLTKPSITFKHTGLLHINRLSAGHYIPYYASNEQQAAMLKLVSDGMLAVGDRLMLLNNAGMLAKAQYQNYAHVVQMLSSYTDEQSEPVWTMMSLIIGESRRFIDLDDQLEAPIKTFIQSLTASELKRLSWDEHDGEGSADRKLRATILGLNAYAEQTGVLTRGIELFDQYKAGDFVAGELRSLVMGIAVRKDVPGAFEYLLHEHDKTLNSDLKADITAALTTTRDSAKAELLLARLMNTSLVKPQDADVWIIYLLRNRHTRDVAWGWMEQHWNWIEKTYNHDKSYDNFPRFAAGVCNTSQWADRYNAFFMPKRAQAGLQRNIDIGTSEVSTRVGWLQRDLSSMQAFFKK